MRLETLLFAIVNLGLAASCVGGDKESKANDIKAALVQHDAASTQPDKGPRVQPAWQAKMIDYMNKNKYAEAWGLFSAAGWADDGQSMLYSTAIGQPPTYRQISKTGAKTFTVDGGFTLASPDNFMAAMAKADALSDYTPTIMDAMRYEYVHVQRQSDNTVIVQKRLLMIHVTDKTSPEHAAMIKAFKAALL